MRGEVVGIDFLKGFELLHGFLVAVPLVIGDAQLAPRVAGLRELDYNSLQVGQLFVEMSFAPLHQGEIV